MTIFIEGIGNVPIVHNEYTHPDVAREYKAALGVLTDIYARRPSITGNSADDEYTAADYDAIVSAITTLKDLAENGLVRNVVYDNPNSPTEAYYLTTPMAQNLDLLLRSLKMANISVPSTLVTAAEKKEAIVSWVDLAGFGVAQILQSAVDAGINNRSLQSLIELEYVKTGNDIIGDTLADLEEALGITKEVLDSLEQVQDIRNQVALRTFITLNSFLAVNYPGIIPGGTLDSEEWMNTYSRALNSYIRRIFPSFTGTPGQLAYDILNLKATLRTQLDRLEAASPDNNRSTPGTLAFNLNQLIGAISLVFTRRTVTNSLMALTVNDHPSLLTRAAIDFLLVNVGEEPLLSDEFKGIRTANFNLENSISTAITSAQSLNDTQKQDVRRFLFIFEEFYKSASAVLTKISQLIEKFAQNIAR